MSTYVYYFDRMNYVDWYCTASNFLDTPLLPGIKWYVGTLQHEHGVAITSFRLFARLSYLRSRNTNFVYDGMTKITTITSLPIEMVLYSTACAYREKDIWPGELVRYRRVGTPCSIFTWHGIWCKIMLFDVRADFRKSCSVCVWI